jgi:hypothetical protein
MKFSYQLAHAAQAGLRHHPSWLPRLPSRVAGHVAELFPPGLIESEETRRTRPVGLLEPLKQAMHNLTPARMTGWSSIPPRFYHGR